VLVTETRSVTPEWYDAVSPYGDYILTNTQWEIGVIYDVNYGPTHDEYIAAFVDEYDYEPEYSSAIGFTQGLAIQMAMEKCAEPMNPKALRETVREEVEFKGFYGHFKTDEHGIQIGHQVAVMQWQNGKIKSLYYLFP
jgi:branched-chain amino acid transport system substrate-binding protein